MERKPQISGAAMDLKPLIRDVPDFPKPGIVFKDICPLLGDPKALKHCVDATAQRYVGERISLVVGIESRGFILAPALAIALGCGFAPIRKPGKLPWKCYEESYSLEYGKDRIQLHVDAAKAGDRVLLVDDVLATGGTLAAASALVGLFGAELVGASIVIELLALQGRGRWSGDGPLHSLLQF